ncbi:serine hydrolase domain-containing protein [Erythrobacter sp. GH1-10]|uniref:serine hydrolase domain-containing protein n=1 Tax=Erythrobacter sp. GH1-10 TaxID=3349334 RepID=UPI0038780E8D
MKGVSFQQCKGLLLLAVLWLVAGCASHGPVTTMPPAQAAPYDQFLLDDRYESASVAAREQLETARSRYGLPSLSAAVSVNGQLVWAGVIGWSDVENLIPATIGTRYRLGSSSKAVTATALARLVDSGVMDIDLPISTWMHDLPRRDWGSLTPRQLASHTAGIVDYEQNRDIGGLIQSVLEQRQYDNVRDALSVFDGNGLKYTPGSDFHYSSFDVVLLSAAMEEAAGEPFLSVLDGYVFRPLGNLSISADHQDRDVRDRAEFYHRENDRLRRWRAVNHSYKWAAGGLIGSSSDLVLMGGAWFDESFITAGTREMFWTPQALSDGQINEQRYAIGWRSNQQTALFGSDRPIHNVHHGGVSKGSYSWLNLYPELRLAVALNTNARLENFADFVALEYPITRAFSETLESAEVLPVP